MASTGTFERSLGDETAAPDRKVLLGSSLYPPYIMKCAAEKPVTCPLPGAAVEVLELLASKYEAQFDLVNFGGYGFGYASEGNTTITRALVDGLVEAAGPGMWYISERVSNVPNFSFPINMESLCAVMMGNSSYIKTGVHEPFDVQKQGPVWGVLVVIGIIIYFFHWFIVEFQKENSVAYHVLSLNVFLHSLVVLLDCKNFKIGKNCKKSKNFISI